jgi:putative oxygen-independent coproporphyrinogen III oxidase
MRQYGTRCIVLLALVSMCKSFSLFAASSVQQQRQSKTHQTSPTKLSVGDTNAADGREEKCHPVGLYVHIPYCRRRCRYCDFAIVPIGPRVATEPSSSEYDDRATLGFAQMNRKYLSALLTELQSIQPRNTTQIYLESIYFGGGTPSLAPVETIADILNEVRRDESPFTLKPDAEISIEMDPGTFSVEKLRALKELGINRISLGVQSFDDTLLEAMGRVHRLSDIYQALESILSVYGVDANYSIDLISGVPGLTLAKWVETLQQAASLVPRPSHMSIYDLQIEQGTVFSDWYDQPKKTVRDSIPSLPAEEDCGFMYRFAAGYLKAKKYEHYEVSSYAYCGHDGNVPSSKRSRHNQIYWAPSSSWYAIGLGATSFVDGRLLARPKTLVDYHSWVDQERKEPQEEKMDDQDFLTDLVMKRLRTSDGLNLDWIEERFGRDVVLSILKGASLGLDLGLAETINLGGEQQTLRLKDPDGLIYSNYIISSIFVELGCN